MPPPFQKSDVRPISFILHDMAAGNDPIEVPLVIRPEDLTRTDQSRLNVVQTLGGAFTDSFGAGLPSVQIAGHTGWGAGDRPDGLAQFLTLHTTIYQQWHTARDEAIKANKDPDKVKLIFADVLDEFTWVVAPQTFVLKRNRSRPLFAQYQINLVYISDNVTETMEALSKLKEAEAAANADGTPKDAAELKKRGLDSLLNSIEKAEASLKSKITSALGPVKSTVDKITKITADVQRTTYRVLSGIRDVEHTLTRELLGVASGLSQAASNVSRTVVAIRSMPFEVKAQLGLLGSAFANSYCVLNNAFTGSVLQPDYGALYGASNCSSTGGGRPISPYDTRNPFPDYLPDPVRAVTMTSDAQASLSALQRTDPVLSPMTDVDLARHVNALAAGLRVNV